MAHGPPEEHQQANDSRTVRERSAEEGPSPYVPAGKRVAELTIKAVVIGLALNVVMLTANMYLGMRSGMTISASIPAAVISMGLFYGLRRIGVGGTILENNIVQTMTSAGEALAAGVIFTIAGVTFLDQPIDVVNTAVVAALGGLLGILFMIPMRRYLIVKRHEELPYPEGTACADVLEAGSRGDEGVKLISVGFLVSFVYMWLANGMAAFRTTLETAFTAGETEGFAIGGDFTPALVGVGYIIGPRIAGYVFGGGLIAWMMLIPLLITGGFVPESAADAALMAQANAVWDAYIRYVGAGAMIVGGFYAIVSMRGTIVDALGTAVAEIRGSGSAAKGERKRTQRDLPMKIVVIGAVLIALALVAVPQVQVGLLGGFIAVIAAFLFVAVSAYLVGVVGSSSNPVSGMAVATILIAALALRSAGVTDPVVVLMTASVVAIAAAVAGDTSQDLKTGYLLGATPRNQQIAQVIGIALSALFAGWVLYFFHQAYGIGSDTIPAPQAGMMALISEGVLTGTAQWGMILIGAVFAFVLILMDVPVLPFAVGIYLPITLATPIFLGGLLRAGIDRYVARRDDKDGTLAEHATSRGRIVAAGLITGEAIMGIVIGTFYIAGIGNSDGAPFPLGLDAGTQTILGVVALVALVGLFTASVLRNAPDTAAGNATDR
ncbi:oligopeptide transporter, OPT family [Halobiforma lacisalsi AJ5]|uniref:Oligopeptide transporter OPT family protein n=1 Tax=Natronobacterium lacisalsi AJ5 TaxID=358396 RepID=M0LCE5_NATLA|nr:oligopeptide transporter, OPT family [Halobiforma lacisalsi]APW99225.1 oligopeptide transporter, OPT family [Halobiforma lacisalsi AJ5]EMA30793.1 oligopeptide transporter OPT family protein [Halobiforma lacisalsi AJ5]